MKIKGKTYKQLYKAYYAKINSDPVKAGQILARIRKLGQWL
jgi:hypothetical protein